MKLKIGFSLYNENTNTSYTQLKAGGNPLKSENEIKSFDLFELTTNNEEKLVLFAVSNLLCTIAAHNADEKNTNFRDEYKKLLEKYNIYEWKNKFDSLKSLIY